MPLLYAYPVQRRSICGRSRRSSYWSCQRQLGHLRTRCRLLVVVVRYLLPWLVYIVFDTYLRTMCARQSMRSYSKNEIWMFLERNFTNIKLFLLLAGYLLSFSIYLELCTKCVIYLHKIFNYFLKDYVNR